MSEQNENVENTENLNTENPNTESSKKKEQPPRPMAQRVMAWIAIVLLVGMYTVTLISAISGGGSTSELFMMSMGATVVLPGLLWLYIRFWKFSSGRDRETFREDIEKEKSISAVAKGENSEEDSHEDEEEKSKEK